MALSRLLLVAALSLCATLTQAQTLIAIDNANPPFMYQEHGQAQGLYPLMLHAIFARLGEPLEIRAMPWKRALLKGASGESGIAGIYKNAERLQIYDYSEPIFEERLLLYVNKDKPFEFHQISDLYGRQIGVIRGWSYTADFDEATRAGKIPAQEGSSDEANLKKLASGRLDAVIAIELAGQRLLLQPGLGNLVPLSPPLSINPTFLVFAKQAGQGELLARFNRVLRDMRQDGSWQTLVKQATQAP